jgi:hypothetical protein
MGAISSLSVFKEDTRMKTIATLTTATVLLASVGTYAFAQAQAPAAPPAAQEQGRPEARRGMSQDDFNRLVDARVASIKAGLKLSPDQERLWSPVETAIRDSASQRFTRMAEFRDNRDQRRSMDFMQRLEQRSTLMNERAQTSTAISSALRPLWNSFNDDQKRIAPRLMREALNGGQGWRERGGHRGRRFGMMEHGMMGRGGMSPGGTGPDGMGPGPRGPAPQQQ